jgi:translation elongation factor EF-Ts
MNKIDIVLIKDLRQKINYYVSIQDCIIALQNSKGNIDNALAYVISNNFELYRQTNYALINRKLQKTIYDHWKSLRNPFELLEP